MKIKRCNNHIFKASYSTHMTGTLTVITMQRFFLQNWSFANRWNTRPKSNSTGLVDKNAPSNPSNLDC